MPHLTMRWSKAKPEAIRDWIEIGAGVRRATGEAVRKHLEFVRSSGSGFDAIAPRQATRDAFLSCSLYPFRRSIAR